MARSSGRADGLLELEDGGSEPRGGFEHLELGVGNLVIAVEHDLQRRAQPVVSRHVEVQRFESTGRSRGPRPHLHVAGADEPAQSVGESRVRRLRSLLGRREDGLEERRELLRWNGRSVGAAGAG